ncbi:MAG: dTMP kinase, partial [Bdellovibrionales bacterium]|nr:dTMP kinase [Bdellovibrionales bacterium]
GEPRSPLAEALLFSADRAQHVEHLIQPAIQAGKLVLVDRYYYSTVAFQGYGRGYSIETLLSLSDIAIQMCKPDIVLLLDLDPAAGLKRNAEKEEEDRFELEEIEFHTKLRQGFLDLAKNLEEPFAVLDARRAPESILQEAVQYIDRVLASR